MRRAKSKRKLLQWMACITFFFGMLLFVFGGFIHCKALLAQYLLRSSWEKSLASGASVKPWPWSDTFPVARLFHEPLGVDMIVLGGDQGAILAFGPGHMRQSSLPPEAGNCIIAGHRDTSFSFLHELGRGDNLGIQDRAGKIHTYEVTEKAIVHRNNLYVRQDAASWLTLITCYPPDGLHGAGDLRLVVSAVRRDT